MEEKEKEKKEEEEKKKKEEEQKELKKAKWNDLAFSLLGWILIALLTLGFFWFSPLNSWINLGIIIIALGCFWLQGLKKIPANPPHKGVVTIFGKRTRKVKNEGWRFFPVFPYWHDCILINVTKINYDLPSQIVRTPDFAELEIPISLTWTPAIDMVRGANGEYVSGLINYLNAGGENGVKTIINDVVRERLREWAISRTEGPQNWEAAMGAREEAINVLLKQIAGDEIGIINFSFPTAHLLHFYDRKINWFRKMEIKSDDEEDKKREEEIWDSLEKSLEGLNEEQRKTLVRQVEERKRVIVCMRQGNGGKILPQLGIRLDRLNIGEIKPRGKLAESAEKQATEKREMKGDEIRVKNIIKRIKELKSLDISSEQALEIIQTERGKVTKSISEGKLNLSPETRELLEKILKEAIDAFRKR